MAPSLRWRRGGGAGEHTWLRWRFPEISQLVEEPSAGDGTGIRTTGRTKSSSGAPSSAAGSMAARARPRRDPKRQRDSGAGSRARLAVRRCPMFYLKTCLPQNPSSAQDLNHLFVFPTLNMTSGRTTVNGLRQALNMRASASVGMRAAMAAQGMRSCVTETLSVRACSCDRVHCTSVNFSCLHFVAAHFLVLQASAPSSCDFRKRPSPT